VLRGRRGRGRGDPGLPQLRHQRQRGRWQRPDLRRRLTRRARIGLAVAATTSLAGAGPRGWAVIVEPGRLVVRETRVVSTRWPAGRPPLRIAVLTDLHVGSFRNGLDRLDEVVARTNAERPDLVVILGDLVIHEVLL